jgi:hypothetical protein
MKTCTQCSTGFEVTDWDRKFYDRVSPTFGGKKIAIPQPTLCPQCRYQRRAVWRTELHLFRRQSSKSGKPLLSYFPPEAPYQVYSVDEWWADDWNPLDYGQDFDFTRPFFEQFNELIQKVPLKERSVLNNQNCDYINCASYCKNCYLIAGANYNEDCYYGNYINYSKNSVDCAFIDKCELCYECVDCKDCYNLKYSTNCHNCSDSAFLYNCRNSRHCFGSVNLVGKQYVYMNKQLTKEEYEEKMKGLQLDRRERVQEAHQFFEKHRLKYPHKYMLGELNENVTGNAVNECRNTFYSFDVSKLEDCKYCAWFHESKNCMDVFSWGVTGTEECYECMETGNTSYHNLFSAVIYNGTNMTYCFHGFNSQDCFGCVGMRNNRYCIFNKQYTEGEYHDLAAKITRHMQQTEEWGQYFPMSISPWPYNQSVAQDYQPLTKEEALTLGAKWADEQPVKSPEVSVELPDSIHDIDDSICQQILTCEATGKPYKIIPQEFKFYKERGIPVPSLCFEERHKNRLARRNPRQLWDRQCAKCQAVVQTSYAPEQPEIVYCESCYLGEVY